MGNGQVNKSRQPCGNSKKPSGELPIVECKRMHTSMDAFEWSLGALSGRSIDSMKEALANKLRQRNGEEREKAAHALLDAPGDKSVKIASLIAIKELGLKINVGLVSQKVFSGRKFEECKDILDKAGISLDEDTIEKIKRFCKDRTMPISLYSVNI